MPMIMRLSAAISSRVDGAEIKPRERFLGDKILLSEISRFPFCSWASIRKKSSIERHAGSGTFRMRRLGFPPPMPRVYNVSAIHKLRYIFSENCREYAREIEPPVRSYRKLYSRILITPAAAMECELLL